MNLSAEKFASPLPARWGLVVGVVLFARAAGGQTLDAIPAAGPPPQAGTAAEIPSPPASAPGVAGPPRLPEPPPPLPVVPGPVDRFRELLAKSPAEREAYLATRSPAQQEYLRARLTEFDALPPAERELRLHLLNLRYHLLPLLRLAPDQRGEHLRRVPREYRELIAERLAAWDQLPPGQQQEILAGAAALDGALPLAPWDSSARRAAAVRLPPEQRQRMERDLERWETLPPAERARITRHFESFLAFTEAEKEKVLRRLEVSEREKAARLIQALKNLPAPDRVRSLEALQRFSALSLEQRERFLQNAARWQVMSEEERAAWRRLRAVLPPLPPASQPPPPLPRPAGGASGTNRAAR